MPPSTKRRRRTPALELARYTIGNALVVSPPGKLTAAAQSFAMSLPADPDNDVVVVDLPVDTPVGTWASVAAALPRRRRGLRLLLGGRSRETAALTGQWLAERLRRPVLAPDGMVVHGVQGGLFVHSGRSSGWIRFQAGKPPQWEAKRFPRPSWDGAAVESVITSATGVAEPIPGGVWIHSATPDASAHRHRSRLATELPCQPDAFTIVLGCPGSPGLSLDDVIRFWHSLDAPFREQARFVQYGPVWTPPDEALGQVLADVLREPVHCYTGLPTKSPEDPDVYTLRATGELGWRTFVGELRYLPRAHPDFRPVPEQRDVRVPIEGVPGLSRGVYWYAADAALEVVQAGLWIRPHEEPDNAEVVRATRWDPDASLIVFDDTDERVAARMRSLAEDARARLDPATRALSRLASAAELGGRVVRVAGLARGAVVEVRESEPPGALEEVIPTVALTEVGPSVALSEAGPTVALRTTATDSPAGTVPPGRSLGAAIPAVESPVGTARPAGSAPIEGGPVGPAGPTGASVGPAPVEKLAEGTVPPAGAVPVADSPPAAGPSADGPAAPEPATGAPAGLSLIEIRLESTLTPAEVTGAAPVEPAAPPEDVEPAGDPDPGAGPADTEEAGDPAATAAGPPRLQPTPAPEAAALLPPKGLERERDWLRRTLSHEFDAMANSISRILSEHPGFQGSDRRSSTDLLTDTVAVRLYLSALGANVDRALRTAAKGPHVPLARCAVSGLTRLPSHRGATVFAAAPTPDQWRLYEQRRVLTEWGFTHALTSPSADQPGEIDVLVWSMTARRTSLLEPDDDSHVAGRVVFVPGTSFKVLDLEPAGADGGRGRLLLREIGPSEIDDSGRVADNRVSLDELAMTSLRRSIEKWAKAEPAGGVGPSARSRFGALPGLV